MVHAQSTLKASDMYRVERSQNGYQYFVILIEIRGNKVYDNIVKVFYSLHKAREYKEVMNESYSRQRSLLGQDGEKE